MDVKGRSFTILGAGRSGIAVSRLLKKNGAKIFLSDENSKEKLKYLDEKELENAGIEFELGSHSDKIFESEFFIKSPGIPPDSRVIIKAESFGNKIFSEIEAAYWFCKCPVIAVTGTNGKTTTAILIGEIFKKAGVDVKVCGNVGVAFSEVVEDTKENSIVVLEVSSFQLHNIEEFKPKVAVLLNITPDHIDWHKNFGNYLKAKLRILENQTNDDLAIVNYDDDTLKKGAGNFKSGKAFFSIEDNLRQIDADETCYVENNKIIYSDKKKKTEEEIMDSREINIRGNHNLYNSLAAIISAKAFEIKNEIIKETLQNFKGVEHRIEFVREINGIKFYNDSKATNIDSLIVALESFDENLILILGGKETGNDYSRVDNLVKGRAKTIIAIGDTKEKIYDHFNKYLKSIMADSMDEAVKTSFKSAVKGDIVLLSPACKSFDMFDNFEHRGEVFKNLVNGLK